MLAVELQLLRVWKACSPHAVERAPSKGTGTEEVAARPWGKNRQATQTAVAEDGESSRKQAGMKEGRKKRMQWVEMVGDAFQCREKDSEVCGQEGKQSQGHHEFMWLIKQTSSKTS